MTISDFIDIVTDYCPKYTEDPKSKKKTVSTKLNTKQAIGEKTS